MKTKQIDFVAEKRSVLFLFLGKKGPAHTLAHSHTRFYIYLFDIIRIDNIEIFCECLAEREKYFDRETN